MLKKNRKMLHRFEDLFSPPFDDLSVCYPFYSLTCKATRNPTDCVCGGILKTMYLIFTVMMSILFLSVLVSQHVKKIWMHF